MRTGRAAPAGLTPGHLPARHFPPHHLHSSSACVERPSIVSLFLSRAIAAACCLATELNGARRLPRHYSRVTRALHSTRATRTPAARIAPHSSPGRAGWRPLRLFRFAFVALVSSGFATDFGASSHGRRGSLPTSCAAPYAAAARISSYRGRVCGHPSVLRFLSSHFHRRA